MDQTEGEKRLPLTGLVVGSVSPAVLVCGDPGRATRIAGHLDGATLLGEQREYRAYHGEYLGTPVTVCSHGIGSPGAAIAFEELVAAGGRQIIRVGTCGSLQPSIGVGALVIATAAVQHTGYGREVVPAGYPPVADLDLTQALRQAATSLRQSHQSGIVLTRDAFYAGVPAARVPDYQALFAANVLCVEMECAALFLVGSLRKVQTGAILAVDGNVLAEAESMDSYAPHQAAVAQAVEAATEVALQAVVRLQGAGAAGVAGTGGPRRDA